MGKKRVVYVRLTIDEANAVMQLAEEASIETFESTHADDQVERMQDAAASGLEKLREAIARTEG